MVDFAEWKHRIQSQGIYLAGQDPLPSKGLHLYILIDRKKDLDLDDLVDRMKLSGVYAQPLPKNSKYPNVYQFIGDAKPVEVATEFGTKEIVSTVDTLEEITPVDLALVSKWEVPSEAHPEKIREIKESIASLEEQRKSNRKRIFSGDQQIGPDQWVILRARTKPGVSPFTTSTLQDILNERGFKSFAIDTGVLGLAVSSADWRFGNMTEVLFNPGNQIVSPNQMKKVFNEELLAEVDPISMYDLPFLREHQELFSNLFRAKSVERAAGGVGGGLGSAVEDLLGTLETVLGSAKYLVWGAVGLGALLIGTKAYSLVKEWTGKARE